MKKLLCGAIALALFTCAPVIAEPIPSNAIAIVPSDTTPLPPKVIGIYVGNAGTVEVQPCGSARTVIFKNVANGAVLRIRACRVPAAGTTARDLLALLQR